MPQKAIRLCLIFLAGVSFFLAPFLVQRLHAQVLYGSVTGVVTDASGAVVPGAKITITNDATGLKREATSDGTGVYRVLDLPQGTYTIDLTVSGFRPLKRTDVRVAVGQVNSQDLQLEVGGVTQEVTVQASVVSLQTEKADVHTTISSFAITNLPTDPYRNFQTVELLAPGVFSDSQITRFYPNSYSDTPERSLNIDANGLPPHINTTRVDGATNLFIWLPNHMLVIPPQDTIQEVNVQTSNFDVEKGLTAGVATDVVSKSGTNELHGTVYAFHSDNAMDASNVFYPGDQKKAKHIVNQDGGTIGGPIKKNKLFFFANWEGLFERNNYSASALLPPTAQGSISDWRGGDFSSALGEPLFDSGGNPIMVPTTEGGTVQLQQGMVFDPTTGNADGTGRAVFSSNGALNVIPSDRLNPGAMAFMGLVPTPNYFPQGQVFNQDTTANYFISTVNKATRQIFGGKIDWNRSDKHTIWGKYMGQNFNYLDLPYYGAAGGATGTSHQFAQTETLGHTWTISPSMVLTGHLGFTRMAENSRPPSYGKPLGESLLGIPGANAPDGDPLYTGLPGIYMGYYSGDFNTLGDANSWQPVFRNDWTATTSHNVTVVRGSHEIRFGFDLSHNHLNHWQPEIYCCPRGYLIFHPDNSGLNLPVQPIDADYTQMPVFTSGGVAAGKGYATGRQNEVALFDLGIVSETEKSRQYIKNTAMDSQFALYVGDRWKVTPKFTVDVGVRWEYFPLIVRDGAIKFEQYNPLNNETLLGGVGGNPIHLGATSSKRLFMPRLGLAYRLKDKTVIRAGFGMSNDTLPLERPLRGFFPLSMGADNVVPNTAVSAWQPLGTFADGIPLIPDPDISSGAIVAPNTVIVGTLAPGEFKRAYIESWNFFVENQLPREFLLSVGYVGNHYVHEMNGRNMNPATLGGTSASQPLVAAFGRTAGTYLFQGYLDSHYNSLQTTVNRHFSKGLYVQGSYTWSKAIGYTSDNSWGNGLHFVCAASAALPQGCQSHNRGALDFDHTQMLKAAFVYELPFGTGKQWAKTERVSRAVLGGWQVNGVFSAWTGQPLTLGQSGGGNLNTPGSNQSPNQIAPVKYPKGQGPGQYWFDPASFAPVEDNGVMGTVGRNPSWLRGPGLVQMDASLFRHFKLTERYDLELRAEAQNLTNSPHFWVPNTTCTDVLGACGGKFGQISFGYGERYVQLGLKLKF